MYNTQIAQTQRIDIGLNIAAGWVYLLVCGWHYKIGKSKNVKSRVSDLQTSSPYKIELVCAVWCDNMASVERELHKEFAEHRTNGEWFDFSSSINIDEVFYRYISVAVGQTQIIIILDEKYLPAKLDFTESLLKWRNLDKHTVVIGSIVEHAFFGKGMVYLVYTDPDIEAGQMAVIVFLNGAGKLYRVKLCLAWTSLKIQVDD